ncbi:MAG: FadR/GntR family transcriptional regulator [Candidatus Latescibacterota bacterium]|nr:FadR/GntR family transcriptional regulator [Candidatus Latescibacterota bacterium]
MKSNRYPKFDAGSHFHQVGKTSVSDSIVAQIVDLISRRVLSPGDRLPSERELCRRLGVGRTSVREAIRSLSSQGILVGRVGEGTFVTDPSEHVEKTLEWGMLQQPGSIEDLVETRLLLETAACEWAATRAGSADLAAIAENVERMAGTLDSMPAFGEADVDFHLLIARAAHNQVLYSMVSLTRRSLQEWIRHVLQGKGRSHRADLSLHQHRQILACLQAGDAAASIAAMAEHIQSSLGSLREFAGQPGVVR